VITWKLSSRITVALRAAEMVIRKSTFGASDRYDAAAMMTSALAHAVEGAGAPPPTAQLTRARRLNGIRLAEDHARAAASWISEPLAAQVDAVDERAERAQCLKRRAHPKRQEKRGDSIHHSPRPLPPDRRRRAATRPHREANHATGSHSDAAARSLDHAFVTLRVS